MVSKRLIPPQSNDVLTYYIMPLIHKFPLQRHIQVANNSPVNCQIRNEGEVNLFEMAVEVDVNGRRSSSVSIQA
jgi:hypothetical protein